jgi:hypothetical protein
MRGGLGYFRLPLKRFPSLKHVRGTVAAQHSYHKGAESGSNVDNDTYYTDIIRIMMLTGLQSRRRGRSGKS